MRLRAAALVLVALALAGPSAAQTVESTFSAFLTARIAWPASSGDRVRAVRIGTKDLTAPLLEELGVAGSRVALVTRRPIGDLGFSQAVHWLVVDDVAYDVTNRIRPAAAELPDSYFTASRSSVKDRTGREVSFYDHIPETFQIGDFETHGSELTLVGKTRRTARLATRNGEELGFLFRGARTTVLGGLAQSFVFGDSALGGVGLVKGRLVRGPEKLVEP
jgi:hypothetical protein